MLRQVERQLENEKAALLERKRREQAEQKRKQADLERILEENRRKVQPAVVHAGMPESTGSAHVAGGGCSVIWASLSHTGSLHSVPAAASCVRLGAVTGRGQIMGDARHRTSLPQACPPRAGGRGSQVCCARSATSGDQVSAAAVPVIWWLVQSVLACTCRSPDSFIPYDQQTISMEKLHAAQHAYHEVHDAGAEAVA